MPGGGGGDGGGVEHQGGGVVEEGLSLQDGEQPPGQAQPPRHAGGRGGVCGPHRGAEHKRHGPGQVTDPVGDRRDGDGGGDHQQHGQRADRSGVAEKPGRRRGDRGVEDEQREQPEQHHFRLQGHVGDEGRNPMIKPATTSTTGAGMPTRREMATAVRVTEATQSTMRI